MKLKYWFVAIAILFVFSNISVANDWSSKAIDNMKKTKVMQGYPNGDFAKKNFATREEMAVALDRIVKMKNGDIYIIEEKQNNVLMVGIAILCLMCGITAGYLIGARKIEPVVNIQTPEINPVINISGIGGGSEGLYKAGVGSIGSTEKSFAFEEERYRPKAATFKENLSQDSQSSIQIKEDRGSEDKGSIDSDLEKLKKFQKRDGN